MENTTTAVKTETEIKDNQTPSPESTSLTTASSEQQDRVDATENASTDMTCILESQEIPDEQEPSTQEVESPPSISDEVTIDSSKKEQLETLFAETIKNLRFWANPKRVERLEQALKVPIYDDRSLQQFFVSARDELYKEALDQAVKTNSVPIIPTEAEIRARAEEKYDAKMAKKSKSTQKQAA